jgi:hypothetical protein
VLYNIARRTTVDTIDDIYASARRMAPAQRLQLATLLLDGLAGLLPGSDAAGDGADNGTAEQELRDFAARSLAYAARAYGDEDDLLPVSDGREKAGV